MMNDMVIHPDIEPGVIDNDMLIKCVLEQGPREEAGRLYAEEGVHLDEVTILRLEFLNILRVDHLWMMKSLTKLSISHNVLERIENLNELVGLQELDLSFNKIEKIENLDCLVNIEVLTLFHNQISELENMEKLEKILIFSIGDNLIKDYQQALYLRQFRCLRSLSFKGNPCYKDPKCELFLKAALPRVTYLNFVKISDEEREQCASNFKTLMMQLDEDDEMKEAQRLKKEAYEEQTLFHSKAFVEYLDGSELFESMFEKDEDGDTMLKAGGDLIVFKEEYCEQYKEAMKEFIEYALEQYSLRQKEIDEFKLVLKEAREASAERSKKIIEQYNKNRELLFTNLHLIVDEVTTKQKSVEDVESIVYEMSDVLNEKLLELWRLLMKEEMTLFEQCEEMRVQFSVNVLEMVNKLIENTRNVFGLWRENEVMWSAKQAETLQTHLGDKQFYKAAPHDLQLLLFDRDVLLNSVAQSADNHNRFIDAREDLLITRANSWQENLVNSTNQQEIERDRGRVLEINYFIDNERDKWNELSMQLSEKPDPDLTALLGEDDF